MSRVIADTSFLYALFDTSDQFHRPAKAFAAESTHRFIFPEVALTEVMFLIQRSGGVPAQLKFLASLVEAHVELTSVIRDDLVRIQTILMQYTDARFDFVDCCIMAMAERINIERICTFDRRDFSIFRPSHCAAFELLP